MSEKDTTPSWDEDTWEIDEQSTSDEVATVSTVVAADDVIFTTESGDSLNLSSPPLSEDEARELTNRIRSTADMFYVLIARAHAGRAYEALGYGSWSEYVREEFDISRSRAYQLIDQNNVINAIAAAAPEGTDFHITEAAARDLKSILSDVLPEVATRTEGLTPEDAGAVIEDLVRAEREKKALAAGFVGDDDEDDLSDDREGFSASSGGSGLSNGNFDGQRFGDVQESDVEDFDLDDMDDLLVFDEDPQEVRRNYDAVYVIYTLLTMMKDMPPVDGVISMIPVERRTQVETSLAAPVAWLNEFSTKWNAQAWREENATGDEGVAADADASTSQPAEEDFVVDADVEDIFADLGHEGVGQ